MHKSFPTQQNSSISVSGPARPNLFIFEVSLSFYITKRDKKYFFLNLVAFTRVIVLTNGFPLLRGLQLDVQQKSDIVNALHRRTWYGSENYKLDGVINR